MCPYELKTSLETNGYEVRLLDGTVIGFAEPTDEEDLWMALSAFNENFFCEADSENRAAEEVWGAYQSSQRGERGDERL